MVFGSRSKSSKTFDLKHASDNKEMVPLETEIDVEGPKAEEKEDFDRKSMEEFGNLFEEDFS